MTNNTTSAAATALQGVNAASTLRAIRLAVEDHTEHGQSAITLWAVSSMLEDHYGLDLKSDEFLRVIKGLAA